MGLSPDTVKVKLYVSFKECDSTVNSDNLRSKKEGQFLPASWNCQRRNPGNNV